MQFTIMVNQYKALEWALNAQQAMLFAFLYEVPSWCNTHEVGSEVYYTISKLKIVEEMPLLTDKPDTVYRLMRQLRDKGLIRLSSTDSITLVAITDKGREWNKVGKISDEGRKNIRGWSEKSPTNHITSNQVTSNHKQRDADASVIAGRTDRKKVRSKTAEQRSEFITHLINKGVDAEIAEEWADVRKKKGSTLTIRAISLVESQAEKAGVTLAQAVENCALRGWAGFKAEWIGQNQSQRTEQNRQPQPKTLKPFPMG